MWFLFLLMFSWLKHIQALVKCNGTVSQLQLCSLTGKYNKGVPPGCKDCGPMVLYPSVTIFKISELDEEHNTITMNVLISAVWNDTRVTLETNDLNE